jgi:hypothetical protein
MIMKTCGTPMLLFTQARSHGFEAVALFHLNPDRELLRGRGRDRSTAIAAALKLDSVQFSEPQVEARIVEAESRRSQVALTLKGDTLCPLTVELVRRLERRRAHSSLAA